MRPLIQKAIDVIRGYHENKPPRVIIEAPTGYGKSVSGPLLYRELYDAGLIESFIHVLPLRAILRDLYLCTLIASITNTNPSVCRGRHPPDVVKEALASLSPEDIAYQMGELIIGEDIRLFTKKSPLYDARYIVTTIDSFLYNFFRIPVTEIMSRKKHYAIPRLRILISGVYLDEAHFVFEDEDEASSIYTATLKAINILSVYKVPLIIASATLGERAVKELCSQLNDECIVIRLGARESRSSNVIEIVDKDFADKMTSINWITKLIDEVSVIEKALNLAESGLRVLVVRDRVRDAIDTYRLIAERLGEDKVALIHGLMTRGDREQALNKILGSEKTRIVVGTSVIEAGLNVSFEALITDGSRPRSVVQRIGRVCRYGECEEAEIYIVKNTMLNTSLREFVTRNNKICWRLSFDYNDYRGYGDLMNALEPPGRDPKLERILSTLVNTLFVSFKTIDEILRETNYGLVRTGIVEVSIGDPDVTIEREVKYEDLVNNSMILDVNRVNDLLKDGCVNGVIAAYVDSSSQAYKLKIICESNELVSSTRSHGSPPISNKRIDFKRYLSCIKKAYESFPGDVIYTAILVSSACYEKSMGLVNIAKR